MVTLIAGFRKPLTKMFEDVHHRHDSDYYESRECPPVERILRYIVMNTAGLGDKSNYAEKQIAYEVRRILRLAKYEKEGMQATLNLNQFPPRIGKYSKSAIDVLGRHIKKHGGKRIDKRGDQKAAKKVITFTFPSNKERDAFLNATEFDIRPDDVQRLVNRNRNHLNVDQQGHMYELHKNFVSDDIENGGLGYPWKWVVEGGSLADMMTTETGSVEARMEAKMKAKIKEVEEKSALIIGQKDLQHRKRLEEINAKLESVLKNLVKAAKKKGLKDTPEIERLKKQLEAIQNELVK